MRRVLLTAMVAVIALGFVPAKAAGSEKGFIAAPLQFVDGAGFPGVQRRVYTLSQGVGNGAFGYVVKIDAADHGGTFVIDGVSDATGLADLGLQFYDDLGDEIEGRGPVANGAAIDTRNPGGETGTIPAGATAAIVYMTVGANASFTWTSTPAGV